MTQFNQPIRRSGGGLDVYTGLLLVATLVLVAGVALMAKRNMDHSKGEGQTGGVIKLMVRSWPTSIRLGIRQNRCE